MYLEKDREYLDDCRLLCGLRSIGPVPPTAKTYTRLKESEWSPQFEALMRNRLIVGAFRYGVLHDTSKPEWDRITAIKAKADKYAQTKNKEMLVDIANLCLLVYEEGSGTFEALHDVDHVLPK